MYHFPKASFRQSSLKLGLLAFTTATCGGQSPNVAAQSGVLEEVLVVATRRESSLQDVPVAVSALSESMLIDNQIYSSAELTDLVPSLTLQQGGNARGSSFNVRGVGTQSFSSAAEPSVSTMVDGVVMGRSGMAFAQLPDVQRVEVLRGPQGTLFGKNASAGVIHVITKNPTDEHEGEFSASALEKDEYRLAGTASGPLTDNLGYLITGSYIDDDGFTKNVYDGDNYNDRENYLVRGKLAWQNTTMAIKYTGDWQDNTSHGSLAVIREAGEPSLSMLLPVVPSDDNDKANSGLTPRTEADGWGHALEVNWDIGEHTLTSISAWREWNFKNLAGAMMLPKDQFDVIQHGKSEQEQFTQELRLTSPADQFASYVLGLFYFDQDIERYFQRSAGPGGSLGSARADFTVDTTNYAAYGEVVFNLSDQWRLITGGRYTSDELDYDFVRVGVLGGTLPAGPSQGDTDESNFSGKLALQWDISDSAMSYLSYTQGYKGPAFSISFATDPDGLEAIDPETSDAVEWGVKSSFLDQRMTLNLAAFYTEFKDWQAQAFVEDNSGTGSGGFELSNAGKVSTRGVEFDLMAIPLENLTLYAALAWIKAEIDEFNGAPCSPAQKLAGNPASCLPPAQGGSNTQDLSSGDLPYSPEWRATLSANYLIPLESMPFDLVIRGTGRWQDDVLYSVTQDQGTVQDAYGILDLSLALQDDNDRYTITVFVKNVGDKFYTSAINGVGNLQLPDEGGYNQRYPKFARRTFGLEARYRW